MKSEHELFKIISDLIGYIFNEGFFINNGNIVKNENSNLIYVDVREIIFTPEFIGKLEVYFYSMDINISFKDVIYDLVYDNLNNPVSYLVTLLKIKKY